VRQVSHGAIFLASLGSGWHLPSKKSISREIEFDMAEWFGNVGIATNFAN
jgi:hypothetical protein